MAELCSPRVLVTRFVPGLCRVNSAAAITASGLHPAQVAALLADVAAEMALQAGRVHGDPHAGNVYVRRLPGGGPQLVMLDHGLHHTLSEELRLRLCRLVAACVRGDGAAMRPLAVSFAGEAVGRFFPLLLSPWFVFGTMPTAADVEAARRGALPPGVTLQDVGQARCRQADPPATDPLRRTPCDGPPPARSAVLAGPAWGGRQHARRAAQLRIYERLTQRLELPRGEARLRPRQARHARPATPGRAAL